MASWKKMIDRKLINNGDALIHCTLSQEELQVEFECGHGGEVEGQPFTAWGEKYVYFPLCYDGAEWVGCAPRDPCDLALEHQGGG